jgi:GT2 family glycosyltransferase
MKISIVFPIHNGLNYTKACLYSLIHEHKIEKKKVKFYLIIVDDGSTDGSNKWIASNYPEVILLNGNGNLWWGGGVNLGTKYAIKNLHSDYILWWNNDIIAEIDYFDNLIEVVNKYDTNTIIGSKILLAQKEEIVWSMGGLFDPYTGKKEMVGSGKTDNESMQHPIQVDWLPGMGTLIHKSIFERIGLVDNKTFPQYHGDSDFILRAKENGCKIIVYPSLRIFNDTTNSGLRHQESFILLLKSLFTIRSNYNIKKDFQFYIRYAKSYRAYLFFIKRYYKYVGGFFKWKVLQFFRIRR